MTDYTQTDNPRCLYAAAMSKAFPEWVTMDGIPSRKEVEGLSKKAFADTEERLLPIHTKTAAFYSALDYFSRPHEFSDDVYERVKQACDLHGITEEIPEYTQVFLDAFEKQAADYIVPEKDKFAISFELDGQEIQLLPVNDAVEIESSSAELDKMAAEERIPHELAMDAARNIVKAASEAGLEDVVFGFAAKHGIDRLPDMEKAATKIELRKQIVAEEFKPKYDEIVKKASEGDIEPEEAVEAILELDKQANVVYDYVNPKHGVVAPELVIFGGITKKAAIQQTVDNVLVGDVAVPLDVWNKLRGDVVEFRMNKEASSAIVPTIGTRDGSEASLAIMDMANDDKQQLLELLLDTTRENDYA